MEPTQDEADEPQDGTETAQEETDSSQAGSDALSPGELDISQPFADAPPRKVNFYFFDDIEIVINANSEIGVAHTEPVQMSIDGQADSLTLNLDTQTADIRLKFNGIVQNLMLSGNHRANIAVTGNGTVGNIDTSQLTGNANLILSGQLNVKTVNNGPASLLQMSVPSASGPSTPSAPSSPSTPSAPPDYNPSVVNAVYEANADFVKFRIDATDAVKIYYTAVETGKSGPGSAERLKEWVEESDLSDGTTGESAVTGGFANITVTNLVESTDYVLYITAEAPDGKLSDLYRKSFATDEFRIISSSYNIPDPDGDEVEVTVRLNALGDAWLYWALTTDLTSSFDSNDVKTREDFVKCGKFLKDSGTAEAVFNIDNIAPGTRYRLLVAAEDRKDKLSDVFVLPLE